MLKKIAINLSENNNLILILIIILGAAFRLYGLTIQSLWMDEIFTMNETNPDNSISTILNILKTTDQHPPLYYLSIHYWFSLFGFNDFNARLFSALIGIISIFTTFLLAKELTNIKTALYVAFFVSINYFHIYYSQEARDYILAYLFSTISFWYLIKSFKNTTYKNCLLFGLNASLLMYSHYFGIFTVLSQVILIMVYLLYFNIDQWKDKILKFTSSGVLILLLYAQWIPTLIHLNDSIKSFWIEKPKPDFMLSYFSDYFGNSTSLVVVFTLFILATMSFFIFKNDKDNNQFSSNTVPASFIIIFLLLSIVVTCYVPYIRSIIVVPMIISRYTIVILPSFVILIALGINYISNRYIKIVSLALIFFISMLNLFIEKKYYTDPFKEQIKEATDYTISANVFDYPVYSGKDWLFNYYFKQHSKFINPVIETKILNERFTDSTKTNGFWVMDAHGDDPYKDQETKDYISQKFRCVKEKYFNGATSRFYVKRNASRFTDLSKCTGGSPLDNNTVVALWANGQINTEKTVLKQGTHTLQVYCLGSKADDNFSHFKVLWNNHEIGNYFTKDELLCYTMKFEIPESEEGQISIVFDNDFGINNEDRNLFVNFIDIR